MHDPDKKPDYIVRLARHGTEFRSDQSLRAPIRITRPPGLPDELFAEDCIEFGGMHGVEIHPKLGSFAGYDVTDVVINPEKVASEPLGYLSRLTIRLFNWLAVRAFDLHEWAEHKVIGGDVMQAYKHRSSFAYELITARRKQLHQISPDMGALDTLGSMQVQVYTGESSETEDE